MADSLRLLRGGRAQSLTKTGHWRVWTTLQHVGKGRQEADVVRILGSAGVKMRKFPIISFCVLGVEADLICRDKGQRREGSEEGEEDLRICGRWRPS